MGIASFISTAIAALAMSTKRGLPAYSFLETGEGDILVGKDGSLGTMIRIDGTKRMMGNDDLNRLVTNASTRMASYFGRPGQAVQVWFCRDPDLSAQMLKNMMSVPRNVGRRQALDLDHLFAEREKILPKHLVFESFYMVLWTRLSILSKHELEGVKAVTKIPALWPRALDTQNPFRAARQLMARHRAFVLSFAEDLKVFGVRNEILDCHDALRVVKSSIYPDMTGSAWKPYLPGDQGTDLAGAPNIPWPRRPEIEGDYSHLLWPRLDDQIFDREAEIISPHIVKIGQYLFSSVDMTLGPQDIVPFSDLIRRMSSNEFPWRASFLLEGDGISTYGVRTFLASVLGFSNSENKALVDAVKALTIYRKDGAVPRMRVSFATWAPVGQIALIEDRMNRLQRAVENWGFCQVSSNPGDPLAGVFSSACGLDIASTAPPGLPPLTNALALLPWDRDASPFVTGSVLFCTKDGRPWLYEPGSELQETNVDLIIAKPGMGKSVFASTLNMAFCLSPKGASGTGGAKLPRIGIIDIGGSSFGFISLLKEALPPARQHEVEAKRLRNTSESSINVMDLQLGCRKPMPYERAFLVNFVTLLATDASERKADRVMSDLAGAAIDIAYEDTSDMSKRSNPRPYVVGVDLKVDEAIRVMNLDVPAKSSWYSLVDKFASLGAIREASLAQRYAVPLIEDLLQAVNSPKVHDVYGSVEVGQGGESLIRAFQRVISSCLSEYKLLTKPTQFEIGEARIVSLDLEEVAPAGSGPAEKQTSMVYMLARYVLGRDFYLVEGNLNEIPEAYRAHHGQRIRRLSETPKRLFYDEFHRTKNSPMVRETATRDIREGRKYNVQIMVSSQMLDDFDGDMINMATSCWIMGCGQEDEVLKVRDKFNLSNAAMSAMRNDLNGPSYKGAPVLAVLAMKDGKHEHLLYNKLGPMEIWAYSSTAEDVGLRKRIYAALGPSRALLCLAREFPNGSAKSEINRRTNKAFESGQAYTTDAENNVVETLAADMVKRFNTAL